MITGFRTPQTKFPLQRQKETWHITGHSEPLPIANPSSWKQRNHDVSLTARPLSMLCQTNPALSSRGIQEPNDHRNPMLKFGTSQITNETPGVFNGRDPKSISYDKVHREGRQYARQTIGNKPNFLL